MLIWAADAAQHYGLAPADGGILRPPLERLTFATMLVLMGLVPFAGMLVYVQLYVTRLVRERDSVELTVIGLLAPTTRVFALAEVGAWRYHNPRVRRVNAPWITLWIAGRPFLIDLQADSVDRPAIEQLSADATKARGGISSCTGRRNRSSRSLPAPDQAR